VDTPRVWYTCRVPAPPAPPPERGRDGGSAEDDFGPLDGIELVHLRLPLVAPWVTALGSLDRRDVLLVRVVAGGISGWGECVAQPEPTYTSEYVESAADVLVRHLIPRVVGLTGPFRPDRVIAGMRAVKGHPMARTALEVAALDAGLRRSGRSLATYLATACVPPAGKPPASVPAGVAVGVTGDTGWLLDEVTRRVEEGYRRVKLKVHPGWDIAPVAAVRARWGPEELLVQVDANGSYAGGDDPVTALRPLDDAGLVLIEQPLGDDDLLGHARLARALRTPICLDESITSAATAASALALGACGVINIKAGRVGGLAEAVRVHDLCRAASVPVWCGGMLETGVGRATNLALASLPGFTLPGDLSAAGRFWAEDIVTRPAHLDPGGTIAVPSGPGLGVEVRADLRAVTVRRDWYRAG
jgi:O-succinylbenzoate synthase